MRVGVCVGVDATDRMSEARAVGDGDGGGGSDPLGQNRSRRSGRLISRLAYRRTYFRETKNK